MSSFTGGTSLSVMTSVRSIRSSAKVAAKRTRRTIRRIWNHPSNRHRRLRRVAYASFFQLWTRVTKRPLKVTVGSDSRMFVYLHFAAASEVVYANPPSAELRVWSAFLKPGDCFIDVGANVGVYTLFAIEQGAEVFAFEPNSEAARLFRENMSLNNYTPQLEEVALSDAEGSMDMTFDLGVANHLQFRQDERSSDVRTVSTTTLDKVIGERRVAGVKIDTEGCERIVLQGAQRALAEKGDRPSPTTGRCGAPIASNCS